jgi:hypothetical protein
MGRIYSSQKYHSHSVVERKLGFVWVQDLELLQELELERVQELVVSSGPLLGTLLVLLLVLLKGNLSDLYRETPFVLLIGKKFRKKNLVLDKKQESYL